MTELDVAAAARALAVSPPPAPSEPPPSELVSSVSPSGAWGAVPVWLIAAGATGNAVKLFALLAAKYAPRPGWSAPAPTLAELAAELDVSERAIRKWRDELVELGALAFTRNGPRASTYVVAGIGSAGPLTSEQPFTNSPPKSGTAVPQSPEQRFRPTTTKENSEKTARGLNDRSPSEPARTYLGTGRETPKPSSEELARGRAAGALVLAELRDAHGFARRTPSPETGGPPR